MPKPLTLRFVLRTLERLNSITRVPEEELAKALVPYHDQKRYNPGFLGQYLMDVGESIDLSLQPKPRLCAECGKKNYRDHNGAKYCSHRCRQRAYRKRKRVTLRRQPSQIKRNKPPLGDVSSATVNETNVTRDRVTANRTGQLGTVTYP